MARNGGKSQNGVTRDQGQSKGSKTGRLALGTAPTMSTSTFPALLRRSAFATYDPAVTRIYTSAQPATPSSSSTVSPRSSEYGLKYAVHSKRARYIKVKTLDAGAGLGCDWQSGEKEARFVQRWGDGRTRWNGQAEERQPQFSRAKLEEPVVKEEKRERELMPNVESMSAKEFDRYLEKLRAQRAEFTKAIKPTEGPGADSSFTLLRHSRSNYADLGEVSRFQASATATDLSNASSGLLNGKAHPSHGLAYSQPPQSVGSIPGRVFNQESHHIQRQNRLDRMVNRGFGNTNANWVVGLGGLTASMQNELNMGDISMDFSREDKTIGTGDFTVESANATRPPTVVNLGRKEINPRAFSQFRPTSSAKSASPLDSFAFKLTVKPAATNSPVATGKTDSEPALGSPEWVAKERKAPGPVGGYLARAGNSVNLGKAAGGWSKVQKTTEQRKLDVSALLQSLGAPKKAEMKKAESESQS